MPEMNPKMIYRLDRFGRGGHHRPFNDAGYPGIRIMEAHENYTQQHQDLPRTFGKRVFEWNGCKISLKPNARTSVDKCQKKISK